MKRIRLIWTSLEPSFEGCQSLHANAYFFVIINPDAMPNATYQGKELQTDTWSDGGELALYDFGARMYDPVLGRWHCVDPMYQFDSPYNAMANNPVVNIDPDGMWSIPWGNIMSSIGGFLSSMTATTITGYSSIPFMTKQTTTTQPNLGSGTAAGVFGLLLQARQDGKMIKDAAGVMGSGIVDNYLADVKYYQANKPGFGDDGGDYDMSRYYTDKTLIERNVEHEFLFETDKGTTEWNVKSDEVVSMLNNGINAVLGGAIGGAYAGVPGATIGGIVHDIWSPSWYETVFDVDPRPGDVLKVSYQIEVHVSVLGNNSIQVFQGVEHTDKNGKVLKTTTSLQGKQELGITSVDVELMKIVERSSSIKNITPVQNVCEVV